MKFVCLSPYKNRNGMESGKRFGCPLLADITNDRFWPMLLKNSLSSEKGGWAKKINVHNRSVFDDLAFGQVSTSLGKTQF